MKPPNRQRWQRIQEIFHAALEVAPEKRLTYLDTACGADEVLRSEVERLLGADTAAGKFLEQPAVLPPPRDIGEDDETELLNLPKAELAKPRPTFAPGELVACRFRVIRFVAAGGMGEVYEVEDLELRVRVALKTIAPEMANDPLAMERFRREVHLARQVTHPSVCRCYDLFQHRFEPPVAEGSTAAEPRCVSFLTMELLQGETLKERIRRNGPLSTDEALPIVEQITEGLAAAHAVGVIHRDLKSSNVVLVPSPRGLRAVLTDFGLARREGAGCPASDTDTDTGATTSSVMVGTPACMAPEQLTGDEITPATDVYALGVLLYQMVTGHLPFEGHETPFKRLTADPPSPRIHVADLDRRWTKTILGCLRRQPADRFQNSCDVFRFLSGGILLRWTGIAALLALVAFLSFWATVGRPSEAERLYEEGLVHLGNLDALAAQVSLEKAAELDPDLPLVHLVLSDVWSLRGYKVKAEAEAELAFNQRSHLNDEDQLRIEGRHSETAGSWEEAAKSYQRLYERSPQNLEYGLRLAAVKRKAGVFEEALAVLEEMRKRLRPSTFEIPRIDFEECETTAKLKEFEQAVAAAEQAVSHSVSIGASWFAAKTRLCEAEAYQGLDKLEEATGIAKDAQEEFTELRDASGRADTLFLLADLAEEQGQSDKAMDLYERAGDSYDESGNDSGLMEVYDKLAILCIKKKNMQQAQDYYDRARKVAFKTASMRWKSWSAYNLGRVLEDRDKLDDAKRMYEESLEYARSHGNKDRVAKCLNNLGGVLKGLGDLTPALKRYEESLGIVRTLNKPKLEARRLNNIADVYRLIGKLYAAKGHYQTAEGVLMRIEAPSVQAFFLSGMGHVMLAQGNLTGAEQRFEEALKLRQGLSSEKGDEILESQLDLAYLALARGRAGEAEEQARAIAQEVDDLECFDEELRALNLLTQALLLQDQTEEAANTSQEASGLAKKHSDFELHLQWRLVSAQVVAARGDPDAAIQQLEDFLSKKPKAKNFGMYQLEVSLALGKFELAAGRSADGRAQLDALAADATDQGFKLIADQARQALSGIPGSAP